MTTINGSLRPIATYVLRRLVSSAVAVFVLVVVVFLLIKAIPGDEARVAAGASATPEEVAITRHRLGLDRPLLGQLTNYIGRLLHGDLGTSIVTHAPVSRSIERALPVTLELVVLATVLMIVIVVPAAMAAATHAERKTDNSIRLAVLFVAAVPTFWLALELQQLLTERLPIFPISGSISDGYAVPRRTGATMLDALLAGNLPAFSNALQHYLLPAFVLMLPFGASLFRGLRAQLVAVLAREHVTVARAGGLSRRRLLWRHVLPNAAGPALTITGVEFATMIGAAVLVEAVFGLNGMGQFLTISVNNKDRFGVLAGVLVIGIVVICTNLLVDLLQMVRDPRIRSAQVRA